MDESYNKLGFLVVLFVVVVLVVVIKKYIKDKQKQLTSLLAEQARQVRGKYQN